jgi:peptidoglycan/xylan/chitin deacetylase (PgdA/CDA1 family)
VRRLLGLVALLLAAMLVLGAGAYKLMNSRTIQVAGELVARVDTTEKVVALTFDDGPTAGDTDAILRTLAEHEVRATFFVVGESVAADPESARTIMWDVAVEDYSGGPPQSAEELVRLTVEGVRPGSVVLLHPWHGRTPTQAAIGPVIEELKGRGYRFVTVDELLALR